MQVRLSPLPEDRRCCGSGTHSAMQAPVGQASPAELSWPTPGAPATASERGSGFSQLFHTEVSFLVFRGC